MYYTSVSHRLSCYYQCHRHWEEAQAKAQAQAVVHMESLQWYIDSAEGEEISFISLIKTNKQASYMYM